MFFPVTRGKFNDIEAYLPAQSIKFCEMQYGDWNRIPDKNERWEHFIMKIDFDKGIIGNGSQQ